MEYISFLENKRFGAKPQIEMMFETAISKEIRICMGAGNIMREHSAPGAITIMVLEGRVFITSLGDEIECVGGSMVYFEAKVPHSLQAHEESVIRLSLSKQDSIHRVWSVL